MKLPDICATCSGDLKVPCLVISAAFRGKGAGKCSLDEKREKKESIQINLKTSTQNSQRRTALNKSWFQNTNFTDPNLWNTYHA